MDKNFVINIGRQLGSGGRCIADILARHYGVTAYDRKLIELAAKESGLSQEFFENADEKKSHGFFHSIFSNRAAANALGSNDSYLSNDALFKVQSDIIRELAEKESCIFVGRCADYILRDHPCHINLFFTANLEDRVARMASEKGITVEQAEELVERTDRRRADYYNYYSGKTWGAAESYDLCVNTSNLGFEDTARMLIDFIDLRLKK
jgi:cytidylate kinase